MLALRALVLPSAPGNVTYIERAAARNRRCFVAASKRFQIPLFVPSNTLSAPELNCFSYINKTRSLYFDSRWQRVETQTGHRRASRRGQLAGTRYARQANRSRGLGRGDPVADGASGLQAGTYVQLGGIF